MDVQAIDQHADQVVKHTTFVRVHAAEVGHHSAAGAVSGTNTPIRPLTAKPAAMIAALVAGEMATPIELKIQTSPRQEDGSAARAAINFNAVFTGHP